MHIFFFKVATSDVDDVREVLSYYRQFDDPIEAFRWAKNLTWTLISKLVCQGEPAEAGREQ